MLSNVALPLTVNVNLDAECRVSRGRRSRQQPSMEVHKTRPRSDGLQIYEIFLDVGRKMMDAKRSWLWINMDLSALGRENVSRYSCTLETHIREPSTSVTRVLQLDIPAVCDWICAVAALQWSTYRKRGPRGTRQDLPRWR